MAACDQNAILNRVMSLRDERDQMLRTIDFLLFFIRTQGPQVKRSCDESARCAGVRLLWPGEVVR